MEDNLSEKKSVKKKKGGNIYIYIYIFNLYILTPTKKNNQAEQIGSVKKICLI